jgi:single-strand DNA-binding protein
MSINKVILVGNVGNDPEIRSTSDGREIANFSLATSDSWKDKNSGEKKEKTEWHRVVVFSSGLVGVIKNYVKKGAKLYLEGSLQTRKWTDKDGVEKYTTEIVLQNYNSTLQILDSRNNQGNSGSSRDSYSQNNSSSDIAIDEHDDEIPF